MSENLLKLFLQTNPVASEAGAVMRVMLLFQEIEEAHGTERARGFFKRWAAPPGKNEINRLKGWRILERLDRMRPRNKSQLAREIVAENLALPLGEQLTPRPRPSYATVYDFIRTLERERTAAMALGTWDGPVDLTIHEDDL